MNVMKQTLKFRDSGSCTIGSDGLTFDVVLSGVNDQMVRAYGEKVDRICVNPSYGHLPSKAELEDFTSTATSWSIPIGGVFVLFGHDSKAAAIQLTNIAHSPEDYTVDFEYQLFG